MWDLSSLTRDQTCVLCIISANLNNWTIREAPQMHIFEMYVFENVVLITLLCLIRSGIYVNRFTDLVMCKNCPRSASTMMFT